MESEKIISDKVNLFAGTVAITSSLNIFESMLQVDIEKRDEEWNKNIEGLIKLLINLWQIFIPYFSPIEDELKNSGTEKLDDIKRMFILNDIYFARIPKDKLVAEFIKRFSQDEENQ